MKEPQNSPQLGHRPKGFMAKSKIRQVKRYMNAKMIATISEWVKK